ncbi:5'/3'-nucleotidase SurE [Cyanobacterium stanieri LEGE 03274]|uniref:5'-nucleotidase n=1 Tax=Cyanobacterium stanieri LEGE 03274 TaxID=1828756 RepID=A0ABR9V5R7_9CHRO|nr:5'/3'-nucleotidase SurE [Cyanobacterium stanieri]MBE9222841.1 5'/3'-nucleotidase SurE [Cyanobacterium stanieri LEGE 03274]
MKFVITNDDGIKAEGIQTLSNLVEGDKWVIAPNQEYSGCGHQITTRRGIGVENLGDNCYSVDGTPADCSRLAIQALAPDVDWLLSGINAGGNLGVDMYLSGTVAAVREAAISGVKAIALSHYIKNPQKIDWILASKLTKKVLNLLLTKELPKGHFWNVNLPHLQPYQTDAKIVFCTPSKDPLPLTFKIKDNLYFYQGNYSQRQKAKDSDIDVCFSDNIAVSLVKI